MKLAAIGQVAEVLSGLSTGGALDHDPAGEHQVVLSRHLTPGVPYAFAPRDTFRINAVRDTENYQLREGDVLFMSRGTRNVASSIHAVPAGTIAPVSFFIVRPKADLDPGYLAWYLNQPVAQREIALIRTGAGTPIVQRAAFAQLRIPLPDLETQRRIASLGVAMVRERILVEQLAAASARLHEATSEHIARDLFSRADESDGE